MADKRRDSGEYYPGGRVIARPGTAPQQVVVQWSDVQGKPQIAPLPERYRDSDVKGKINEIASKFATLVVAALIGWSAFGELVVQKAQKDQIWNDEEIVTNAYLTGENASGAARTLPKYLWLADFADSYPDAAAEYYRSRGDGKVDGGCSAVRSGGYLYRNFDFPLDDRAEFVVRMAAGAGRFASVGVAQVSTNLTEAIVTSGKPSRWYKALPGATVDGINDRGVVAEINVVDGDPSTSGWHTGGDLHPLAAIRWALDNGTSAHMVATNLAARIAFPAGWSQNFHYMIADERETWVVEDGTASNMTGRVVMTNFPRLPPISGGMGIERYLLLVGGANITNAWYTNAYRRDTNWSSEFKDAEEMEAAKSAWETYSRERLRGHGLWQSVHTSIYDLTNRTLRIAVQEQDDWYVFAVPVTAPEIDAYTRDEIDAKLAEKANASDLSSHTGDINNPHQVTAEQIGALPETDPYDNQARVYWDGTGFHILHPYIFFDATLNVYAPFAKFTANSIVGDTTNGSLYLGSGIGEVPYIRIAHDNSTGHDYISFLDGSEIRFADPVSNETLDNRIARLAPPYTPDSTDPTFSNAVLAVQIDTNTVAQIGELKEFFDGLPVGTVGTSLGGIILALLGAVAWLKKNALTDGLETDGTPTDEKLHKFFKESNSLLTGTIAAKSIPAFSSSSTYEVGEIVIHEGTAYKCTAAVTTAGAWTGSTNWAAATDADIVARLKGFKSDGTATDEFATNLLGKPVAKTALMIPLEAKTDSFVAEDGHAYAVTMTGTVTITMPTTTEGKAAIFQARFSAAAQQSVQFDTDDVVKFDGTDCGIVKAGKDALLSAMWNGEAWDLVWKNQA